MKCKLILSTHSQHQMNERGISVDEIIETIEKGAKRFRKKKVIVMHKKIEVVYRKKPCHNFVITTYGR